MKKLIALLSVAAMLTFGLSQQVIAQDEAIGDTIEAVDTTVVEETVAPVTTYGYVSDTKYVCGQCWC